jgi:hypothetical protein
VRREVDAVAHPPLASSATSRPPPHGGTAGAAGGAFAVAEVGLEVLGNLLGFDASRSTANDAPDGVRLLSDKLAVAFEARSDETPGDSISLKTVRQANSQPAWVRNNRRIASDADVFTVVVTPRSTIDEGAQQNASDRFHLHVDEASVATRN